MMNVTAARISCSCRHPLGYLRWQPDPGTAESLLAKSKRSLGGRRSDLRPPLGSECEGWGGGGQSVEEKIASTRGKSEAWPGGHACFSSPRIASFRYDNQQKGYERAAHLALAVTVTTVLSGWEPRGTDICNLKPQVERAMSRGIGARENARIKSELMEIRHESQGVICPEAKKSEAFVPCGHLRVKIILWLPGAKSKASSAMRPTCRRDVRSTMRVYLGSEAIAWDSWDGNWEKR